MAGILGNSPAMKSTDVGTSMPQKTAVGSGSRPTEGKTTTPTSAPEQPHTLGRDVAGSLK
jgi:hypothetical protein